MGDAVINKSVDLSGAGCAVYIKVSIEFAGWLAEEVVTAVDRASGKERFRFTIRSSPPSLPISFSPYLIIWRNMPSFNPGSASSNAARSLLRSSLPASSRTAPLLQRQSAPSIRHSHIGASPLYLPAETSLTVLDYPPHPNPARPLPPSLRYARCALVKGPLGEIVVPLQECVQLRWEDQSQKAEKGGSEEEAALSGAAGTGAASKGKGSAPSGEAEPRTLMLSVQDETEKVQRSHWGLARALLANALVGVQEGHSIILRLVGVGYRASVESDPFPRPSKLVSTMSSERTFFVSKEQAAAYAERAAQEAKEAKKNPQRLNLRLGYSHPVLMPVPRGITCTTPQTTRIVLRGVDKEQLGLFASQIRAWRKPEPYKVNTEAIGNDPDRGWAVRTGMSVLWAFY